MGPADRPYPTRAAAQPPAEQVGGPVDRTHEVPLLRVIHLGRRIGHRNAGHGMADVVDHRLRDRRQADRDQVLLPGMTAATHLGEKPAERAHGGRTPSVALHQRVG